MFLPLTTALFYEILNLMTTLEIKEFLMDTWTCPLCDKTCEYGKIGCEDPETCDSEKNIHYYAYKNMTETETEGIGISEISNENKT